MLAKLFGLHKAAAAGRLFSAPHRAASPIPPSHIEAAAAVSAPPLEEPCFPDTTLSVPPFEEAPSTFFQRSVSPAPFSAEPSVPPAADVPSSPSDERPVLLTSATTIETPDSLPLWETAPGDHPTTGVSSVVLPRPESAASPPASLDSSSPAPYFEGNMQPPLLPDTAAYDALPFSDLERLSQHLQAMSLRYPHSLDEIL